MVAVVLSAPLGLPAAGEAPPPTAGVPITVPAPGPVPHRAATHLRVDALGVDAALVPLGLDAAGVLQPPADPADPGWFTGGPGPGETGPMVVAGHVDSRRGPGVFARLADVPVGAQALVTAADGRVERYRVTWVERFPKAGFRTGLVYGPTPLPELRLVTCGGDFDDGTGHYVDNVVVGAVRI